MNKRIEKKDLSGVPRLFETDDLGIPNNEKTIHLHFYTNDFHWYVAECDGDDKFFGFVICKNNIENAYWADFSIDDIKLLNEKSAEIIIDEDWIPTKAGSVDLIKKALNWQ